MENIISCSLAVLEMTFILVALLILHGLRNLIGKAPFYIAVGLLLVFAQLVSATEMQVILGYQGADFYIAPTVLMLPYLTGFMVVYVTEGTLATQRFIIGAMATLGLYVYLSQLTAIQCNWLGYTISQGPSADSLDFLLRQSQRTMAGSILAQALDLFLIPIFFQRLRNLKCRMFIAVIGALMLTQIVDNFVYVTACYWGETQWWYHINSSYIAKSISTLWLSIFATIYITRIEKEAPGTGRGTLDIIFAFFGSYGKAQTLQQRIHEWEGRYRMVVQNASDMIILLDQEGIILDTNVATRRVFQAGPNDSMLGKNFPKMIYDQSGTPIEWAQYSQSFRIEDTSYGRQIHRLHCFAKTPEGTRIELDVAITSFTGMEGVTIFIVLGRDITQQTQLAREKEELREQLAHAQRLESVGQLAGGVAHDFNNYLHAIQGHLDIINYMCEVNDEDIDRHLQKIDDITEKAGMLTQQLLGFARKGKYRIEKIELDDLMQQTVELFTPNAQKNIDFKLIVNEKNMQVKGDPVQLQQVFLNLLINARDALEENQPDDMQITVTIDKATKYNGKLNPPANLNANNDLDLRNYYYAKITDNGEGMEKDVINRIFDPFFTTKPFGKGTGMGLAMAYGTITNHHGWIQVESKPGKGTTFYVFLPKNKRKNISGENGSNYNSIDK